MANEVEAERVEFAALHSILLDNSKENVNEGEWSILAIDHFASNHSMTQVSFQADKRVWNESTSERSVPCIYVSIRLARRPHHYLLTLVLPVLLFSVVALCSAFLPTSSHSRLTLLAAVLLGLVFMFVFVFAASGRVGQGSGSGGALGASRYMSTPLGRYLLGALLLTVFHLIGSVFVVLCGERGLTAATTHRTAASARGQAHNDAARGRGDRPPRLVRVLLVHPPNLVYMLVSRVFAAFLCRCCRVHLKQSRLRGGRETNPVSGTATHPMAEPNPIAWNRSSAERALGSNANTSRWYSGSSPRQQIDRRVRELMLIEGAEGHAARRHRLAKSESVPVEPMAQDELLLHHGGGGGSSSRLGQSPFAGRERLLEEGNELRSGERADISRAAGRVGTGGTRADDGTRGVRCGTGEDSGNWSAVARNLNAIVAIMYLGGNLYVLYALVFCGYLWVIASKETGSVKSGF